MALPEKLARPVLVHDCSRNGVLPLTKRTGELRRFSEAAAMIKTFFSGRRSFSKLIGVAPSDSSFCPLKKMR